MMGLLRHVRRAYRTTMNIPRRPGRRLAIAIAAVAPIIALLPAAVPAAAAAGAPSTGARLAAPAAVPGPPSGWSTVFSDDFNGAAGSGPSSAGQHDNLRR